MSEFVEGEVSYSTIFEISVNRMKGNMFGFEAKEIEHERYSSKKVYKTKNEAIDSMITQLESLKDD